MIRYLPGSEPGPGLDDREVEFVGGPRGGRRETLAEHPEMIEAAGGVYERSVACADDGALRYVWSPSIGRPGSAP